MILLKKLKNSLIVLFLFFFIGTFNASADQLAYISKREAKQAKKLLKTFDAVVLYCGCCSGDTEKRAFISKVKVSKTGYEKFYEVILTYVDEDGKEISEGIDLAYVWDENKKQTIGEILGLDHDPCERIH